MIDCIHSGEGFPGWETRRLSDSITSPEGSCVDLCFPLCLSQVPSIRPVLDVVPGWSSLCQCQMDQRAILVNVTNHSIVFVITLRNDILVGNYVVRLGVFSVRSSIPRNVQVAAL